MDLTGIENEAEFFPAGTLSDVLEVELQDITNRWAKESTAQNPVDRIASVADRVITLLGQMRNTSDKALRQEIHNQTLATVTEALGYSYQRNVHPLALESGGYAPIINRTFDAEGKCQLWIVETPLESSGDEDADPLGLSFSEEQFGTTSEEGETDLAIEELVSDGIFSLADAPKYLLIASPSQWVLLDSRKWSARSVLRFDLQEIYSRQDKDTYRVIACLIAKEARVPHSGSPLSDRLEEEAQRNANAVTSSLKRTVRDAIEILGQEVLDVTGGKFPKGEKRGVWIDGETLSLECLRYMYRLLFLLYAESNPRLGILDLKDPVYASGYSMEALRDLESVRLRTPDEKNGTYLWQSLQQILSFLYSGEQHVLTLPAVKVSLLDPTSTPLLNSVQLRNEAVQKVIRMLSLRQSKKSTGRISYAKLGIGQLGAVYETLISFTGTVAKEDLIELKGDSKDRAAKITDDNAQQDDRDDESTESRVDKVDTLAPTYFVPRRRIAEFNPDAVVFEGTQAIIYPKGSFTYRLAGRDREKTAAYYTPEPLARLLVKHLLMERCKDLSADELLELKILEPAMGSAAFLVETTNQLADLYLERKQKEVGQTIPQEEIIIEKQRVRSFIADRNCFGVDLNPTAVELGAISLWLNGLHKGEFSPWFGDQLHAGNSLIGARRAVYAPSQLKGKTADLWFKHPPKELGWKEPRPENNVFQWLLPAEDMAAFEKDKSIKEFAGEQQKRIKAWRAGGFFKPLQSHEINLVQRLSKVADELFEIVAAELARTRQVANDEITLWPEQAKAGSKGVGHQTKERLKQRLLGEDQAQNTLPFKRLKTAMDAWCALWLWPIEHVDKLPSRQEFLEGMRILLEGGFSADGSLSTGTEDDFALPMDDLFEKEDTKPSVKYNTGLFQETNVEAFVELHDWLQVAVGVAAEARFVHYDLIFADILKARGGFDLIVGNPPWAQPKWVIAEAIGDIDPIYYGLSAAKAIDLLNKLPVNTTLSRGLLRGFATEKGQINFIGSKTNYPLSSSAANNLYRNFIELSFSLCNGNGNISLIHQDAHLSSPKNDFLRKEWYGRIKKSFEFSNQITSKNFSEILNTKRFSLNIYSGKKSVPYFEKLTNMFLASQVDECYEHDGTGAVTGTRNDEGWNVRGHKERIVTVDSKYLKALSKYSKIGLSENPTFLHPLHKRKKELLVKTLTLPSINSSVNNLCFDIGPSEQSMLTTGYVKKEVNWPDTTGPFIITSPSISHLDIMLKTPRRNATNFKHYDPVEIPVAGSDYRPRSMFKINNAEKLQKKYFMKKDSQGSLHHNKYRFAYRKMIDSGGARTLTGAILPPNYLHYEQMVSISCNTDKELLDISISLSSILSDFIIKSLLTKNLYESTIVKLPFSSLSKDAHNRILLLSLRNDDFLDLFLRNISSDCIGWSIRSSGVRPINKIISQIQDTRSVVRLNPLERLLAQAELDVLFAKSFSLELADLEEVYEEFELLKKNDGVTYFDKFGEIVFTKASGLEGLGFQGVGGRITIQDWHELLDSDPDTLDCIVQDDTTPGGPKRITRHYENPFKNISRIDLFRNAWAHFEKMKKEVDG